MDRESINVRRWVVMYAQLHLCTYSVSPVFVKGKLFNTFLSVSGNLIAKLIGYFLCRSIFWLIPKEVTSVLTCFVQGTYYRPINCPLHRESLNLNFDCMKYPCTRIHEHAVWNWWPSLCVRHKYTDVHVHYLGRSLICVMVSSWTTTGMSRC